MAMTATPAAPSLLPGEDTGASDSDGVTKLDGPMLVGQTAPGAVITLYDNGVMTTVGNGTTSAANAVADANGFYSIFPYPVLDDGRHRLTITATAPGLEASLLSPPLAVVVDTSPPDAPTAPVLAAGFDTGGSAADGITAKSSLQLTGMTEPNVMVGLFDGSSDTPLVQAMAGADGTYALATAALADGVHSLTVKAVDLAGNISMASAASTVTIDTRPPATPAAPTLSPGTDTGVSHSDGLTNDTTPVVVGTAEANSTVLLYDGGRQIAQAQADAAGNYAITAPVLTEGPHTLTVAAQDAAGNTSAASAPLAVVVDTTVATVTSTAEADQAIFGSVPFELHFSAPVVGLTPSALQLIATDTAAGEITQITGSGEDYTVLVDGLSGAGTLALGLAPGNQVTDEAGNAVSLTATQSYDFTDQDTIQSFLIGTYTQAEAANTPGLFYDKLYGTTDVLGLSSSGRLVSFDTDVAELPSDTNPNLDVYVKDMRTGGLTLISAGVDGDVHNGDAGFSSLSANGTVIAFVSTATGLVADGPTDGRPNVYVADLTTNPADGGAVDITSIELVSEANGQDGIDAPDDDKPLFDVSNYGSPAVSADGTHVVFASDQPLIDGVTPGIGNIYEVDIATGTLTLISGGPDGHGGDSGSDHASVSADGSMITYSSGADDLAGSTPLNEFENVYLYNVAANTTTLLDGAAQLGLTGQGLYVESFGSQINTLGNWVTYTIAVGSQTTFVVNQNVAGSGPNAGKLEVLTPDTLHTFNGFSTVSQGGRFVTYALNDEGAIDPAQAFQVGLADSLTGTTTDIGPGLAGGATIAPTGNAVGYDNENYTVAGGVTTRVGGQIVLTTFGPTAGIDQLGQNGQFDQTAWQHAVASGLIVTGVSDAGAGAAVRLQLLNAGGAVLSTGQATLDGSGAWSITLPGTDLAAIPDGGYRLNAVASATNGASFPSNRVITVDTMAPAAPDAPKLDAGSDTSLANDGSATNQATPILTGTAEAGSTVTLYDTSGIAPAAIGTAVADNGGIYAITAASLSPGRHTLDVTATDTAGNVSAMSGALAITVDLVAPAAPTAGVAADLVNDTGSSQTDGITSNASPHLVGTAEPGTTVTLYDTDGHTMLGTATVMGDGTYTIASSSLSEGAHTLTVTDTDAAGNVSPASDPVAVTIDTLPPPMPTIVSITGPLVAGDITPLVTVSGTAEPNSKVSLVLDGGMGADSVFGESTAESDGTYSIDSDFLPAGDGQNLTVIATDAAGNASQPSLPADVDITGIATPPPGTPPTTPTLIDLLTDGPIAGAIVFADANGNQARDVGEAAARTNAAGQFTLYGPVGTLVATGGTDTTTGLSLPGALFAPAGSMVIDALTTLIYAYQGQTGATTAQANAAVAAALGLLGSGGTDLTTLDPNAAALDGSASLDPAVANGAAAVADAKLVDLAVDFTRVVLGGASVGNNFADVFTVLAAQIAALPAGGTLDLDDPVTLLSAVNAVTELGSELDGAPIAVATAAEQIVAAGNTQLDAVAASKAGQALLTAIADIETVEQGSAASALGQIGNDPALAVALVPNYTGAPLIAQASVTASSITDAPRLAAGSDGGVSNRDNISGTPAPTFVGTALPGTFVTLVEVVGIYGQNGQVLGSAQADATGHYRITSAPLPVTGGLYLDETPFGIAAVGSATNQNLAVGAVISLPQHSQVQMVSIDGQTSLSVPTIRDATPEAAVGNDAGHSALLLNLTADILGTVQVFADGGSTPIASRAVLDTSDSVTLTTTPLALGAHTLTVTETLLGGTVMTGGQPYTVDVEAPTVIDGTATAIGPIAGGTVVEIDKSPVGASERDAIRSVTNGSGAYAATVDSDSVNPLTLINGYDSITGLPIGGDLGQVGVIQSDQSQYYRNGRATLTAAYDGATAGSIDISPFSSIGLVSIAGTGDSGGNAAFILTALGLDPTLDPATLDPLAQAQAGDPAPLLAAIKLLDTVTLLSPLNGYTFAPLTEALDNGPAFDLDTAATSEDIIANGYRPAYANLGPSAQEQAELASIVAAGNAAIDAHAATATSVADTISYAFAAERLEQTAVLATVNVAYDQANDGDPDGFAAIVASDTGAALDQAIEAARGQASQVVSLVPAGPTRTGAPSVDFTITFGEAVTALAPASFQVLTTGGLQGATITGLAPVAGSAGTSYDVTVSTGIGEGTVALTYLGAGVDSSAGKPITVGAIAPPVTYLPISFTGPEDSGLAVGDFNGDGRPDAVIPSGFDGVSGDPDLLTIFLNQGDGSFQAQPSLATDAGNDFLVSPIVADVNGDGHADIVVADRDFYVLNGTTYPSYGDAVTVLPGNGDGSFQQPINTPLGFVPAEMVAGDFDGDGKIDIAAVDESSAVHILLGDGQGQFTPATTLTTGFNASNNPTAIATGDFNGDGKLDLAVSSGNDGTVTIFLGNGDGTFAALPSVTAGSAPNAIAVGDLNGDGIADIAVADAHSAAGPLTSGAVTVLLGHGDGTFTAAAPFVFDPTGVENFEPRTIAIGDIDNDGTPDLVVGGTIAGGAGQVAVLLGNGDGSFRLGSQNTNGANVAASGLALADANGDGRTDILSAGADTAPDLAANAGLNVFLNEPETVVGSTSPTITIDRPAVAQPTLSKTSGTGTLTQTDNTYTLDLGTLSQGAAAAVALALTNAAAAPADSFDGLFSPPGGSGFAITGADLAQAVAAGGSYGGLSFAADTSTPGTFSETITFAPRDETPTVAPAADPTTGLIDVDAVPNPDAVAEELAPLTLTVSDTVVADGTVLPAVLGTVLPVTLPNVRVGAADTAPITLTNAAITPAAGLDVTATATGAATVSGGIMGLAPGATDATSLVTGVSTAAAGTLSGTVTLAPVSDASGVTTTLAPQTVTVTGNVYRPAVAGPIAPVNAVVHVGDPGTFALPIGNTDPADGYSEDLVADLASVTGGLTGAGSTGEVAPGATDGSLALTVSTANAGEVSGTATVALTSDGGTGADSIDGLGQVSLGTIDVPVAVVVDDFAAPSLSATVNGAARTPDDGVIDLGTLALGSGPVMIALTESNVAAGPADLLAAMFTSSADAGFTDGLTGVSGLGAGQSGAAGMVTLSTDAAGTFSESITAAAVGSDASGYSAGLDTQTLTITGTVAGPASPLPPAAPGIALVSPQDGSTAAKAIINTPTPTVAGTTGLGAGVTVLAAGAAVGSTEADAGTGAYADTLSAALPGGVSTLSASAMNAAGTTAGTQTASAYVLPSPVAGVSTVDLASVDIGRLFDAGYVMQFTSGTEAVDLLDGVLSVGPDTDQAYVQRLYEGLLGRGDDLSGMSYWIARLDAGASRTDVAAGFLSSAEFLADDGPVAAIPAAQYVGILYGGLLGRAPTDTDAAFWIDQLAQNGPAAVLDGIADSPEAKAYAAPKTSQVWAPTVLGTLTQELYGTGLAREPEVAGNTYWQTVLPGLTTAQAAALFVATPEFQGLHAGQDATTFVTSLFGAGLGRSPTSAELQPLVAALQAGTSGEADVLLQVATTSGAAVNLTRNLNATSPGAAIVQATDVFSGPSGTPGGYVFRG